jgi:hypothetical protein
LYQGTTLVVPKSTGKMRALALVAAQHRLI